jgi:hypothetical protein
MNCLVIPNFAPAHHRTPMKSSARCCAGGTGNKMLDPQGRTYAAIEGWTTQHTGQRLLRPKPSQCPSGPRNARWEGSSKSIAHRPRHLPGGRAPKVYATSHYALAPCGDIHARLADVEGRSTRQEWPSCTSCIGGGRRLACCCREGEAAAGAVGARSCAAGGEAAGGGVEGATTAGAAGEGAGARCGDSVTIPGWSIEIGDAGPDGGTLTAVTTTAESPRNWFSDAGGESHT